MKKDVVPVPKGFTFATAQGGFKYSGRNDLMAIISEKPAAAAGVFTKNLFQAAPVLVARDNLETTGGRAQVIMMNAGQANACTGQGGVDDCRASLDMASVAFGVPAESILPASTGVIGPRFDMEKWKTVMPGLAENLGQSGPLDAAKAIMTTDTFPKIAWGSVETPEGEVRLLGMAKGAGMICPNMATLLGALICDADVGSLWWSEAVAAAVDKSFNSVTVDGDTSTNDCVLALANGASGVRIDEAEGRQSLLTAMIEICQALAYMIVQDAEGGTKIVRISVRGAKDHAEAELAARAVGHSPLVKTAMFGMDANWGRIVAALGRSGASFNPEEVDVKIGGVPVFLAGSPVAGDLDSLLEPHMRRNEIAVDIRLGDGSGRYVLLSSDLSYDYVKINADYRS